MSMELLRSLLDPRYLLPAVILAVIFAYLPSYLERRRFRSQIPCINDYPGDWFRKKARQAFVERARELLDDGARKYGGEPYRIITTLGERVIVSKSYLRWVETHPDLDHQAQVAEEFLGSYPGFEGIGAFNDPNRFVIDLIKKKMSSMSAHTLDAFQEAAVRVLEEEFGQSEDYHQIDWSTICTRLIYDMSSTIFVGPRLADNPRWRAVALQYTNNLFAACRVLRAWPAPLRSIAVWFLRECRLCRANVAEARAMVAQYNSSTDYEASREQNAFGWMDPRADAAVVQLALAAGALHTTAQLLNQALLDLAHASNRASPIIDEVRKEFRAQMTATDGVVLPSTLPKLVLLETCLKETQRLKPQTMTNLDRLATRDVTLPNGVRVPRGTMIVVQQDVLRSTEEWGPDAGAWNPMRWFKNDQGDVVQDLGRDRLVNSSDRHFAFGKGRFICPGRFMVNAELKIAMSLVLDSWDVRLSQGEYKKVEQSGLGRVDWIPYGFEMLADGSIGVEVRRRR